MIVQCVDIKNSTHKEFVITWEKYLLNDVDKVIVRNSEY